MNEIRLNPSQSFSATLTFLKSLLEHCKTRFSDKGFDALKSYLGCLFNDPTSSFDWKNAYLISFGRHLTSSDVLKPEEVFTIMIEYCAMFFYKRKYDLSELLDILYKIRYTQEENKKELELWKQSIQRSSYRERRE